MSRGRAILLSVALSSGAGAAEVAVFQDGNAWELTNRWVRVRCESKADGVEQVFFAWANGGWERVAQSWSPPRPFPPEGNSLFRGNPSAQRWLVSEVLRSVNGVCAEDGPALRLSGASEGLQVTQTVALGADDRHAHIQIAARVPGTPPQLDCLLSTFTFEATGTPEFVHSPTLKYTERRWPNPAPDQVIGDRAFHAPAIILQQASTCAALLPDLNVINAQFVLSPDARREIQIPRNQFSVPVEPDKYSMPTALDLTVASGLTSKPVLSFGLMDSVIAHHIRYVRPSGSALIRTLQSPEVHYAFDLFVRADAPPGRGFQDATRFHWSEFGRPVFNQRPHLAMPFAEYVRVTTDVNTRPLGGVHPAVPGFTDTGSFLSFDLQGQPVGGYRSPIPGMLDMLSNCEFWNNVRDAVGMYEWGRRCANTQWVEMARRTINLALLAPQDAHGMFPLNYRAASGQWGRSLFTAAPGRTAGLFSAINEPGDTWDLVAMSRTAAYLWQYYLRCEPDPRIPAFVMRYADGLLPLIAPDGAVPSYLAASNHTAFPALARSAQDGTTLELLAELARFAPAANRDSYLAAARRIADRLIREVLPRQLWTDLEQYYSCGAKPLDFSGDTEQGQPARGNLSTLWAARGFASLYRTTGDRAYLDTGECCLDYLSLSQCCWAPHFIYTAFPFGGFTVDNSDTATFLDARQCEAVAPLAWYGLTLGRQDLLERAVAAARASVVLINHPRHQGVNDIYRHTNLYPLGLGPENIDHEGHPQSAMRTSPSWGEASGAFTGLADAVAQLGGAFIDVSRNLAVGVDGLRVVGAALEARHLRLEIVAVLAQLKQPWDQPYTTELRVSGLEAGDFSVSINGVACGKMSDRQLQRCPLLVRPNGSISIPR